MNKVKKIFHTGITVKNLEKSIEFYKNILGFELIQEPTEKIYGEELDSGLGVSGAILRVAIFKIGDSELELLEYSNPKSPIENPMPPHSLGAMHIAIEVDDIYSKVKELEEKGVVFNSKVNETLDGPLAGLKWVYFKDCDGIPLELVQYEEIN